MVLFQKKPTPKQVIGQQWVDHGYQTTSDLTDPEPCVLCGAAGGNCTGDHSTPESEIQFTVNDPFDNYQQRLK